MDKAHEVVGIEIAGTRLTMWVDGQRYEVDLADCSARLKDATQAERDNWELSPAGYGIHWPDLDEDLSIDGLMRAGSPLPAGPKAT